CALLQDSGVSFFRQKTAYEVCACLVGSEMCIRDRNETQHEGVTPAAAETQASAPEQKPEPVKANVPESTETASVATIDAEKKSAAPVVESSPSSSDKP
ncbi:hypothetical protein MU460_14590, partial [Staphylococcus aureus]|nr:hypothetical protein [Staphylococcus aureus]